jgi:hypothetical protein
LSHNALGTTPGALERLHLCSLTHLMVCDNGLAALPVTLAWRLPRLKHLDCRGNRLTVRAPARSTPGASSSHHTALKGCDLRLRMHSCTRFVGACAPEGAAPMVQRIH